MSAWVKPTTAARLPDRAVSVDGSADQRLLPSSAPPTAASPPFTRRAATATRRRPRRVSTLPAQADQWQHMVGVYNRAAGTLSLYVNGTLQQSVPFTTPWTAGRAPGHRSAASGRAARPTGSPGEWTTSARTRPR